MLVFDLKSYGLLPELTRTHCLWIYDKTHIHFSNRLAEGSFDLTMSRYTSWRGIMVTFGFPRRFDGSNFRVMDSSQCFRIAWEVSP